MRIHTASSTLVECKTKVQKCVTIAFTDWTYNLTIKHEKEKGLNK